MSEVVFEKLRCGVSVRGNLTFNGGRLIADPTSSSGIPNVIPPQNYPNINALAIDVSSTNTDESVQSVLVSAYRFALEVFTALGAKYQTYVYLEKPIICTYQGVRYILDGEFFEPEVEWKKTHVIAGGQGFCDDISFLNKKRNPRLILHFYREAQDETNPIDYRVLQLWRFFEGWFGTRDQTLVQDIINIKYFDDSSGYDENGKEIIYRYKITRRLVNSFYKQYRSAVSHGGGAKKSHSKKVYYPRLLQFYSDIWEKLDDMIKIADELLRRNPPKQY